MFDMDDEEQTKKDFHNDLHSIHFNVLRWMGLWIYDGKDPTRRRQYFAYSSIAIMSCWITVFLAAAQMYVSRDDLAEVSFNLSVNVLTCGIVIKNVTMIYYHKDLEELRRDLFEDRRRQKDEEAIKIQNDFRDTFIIVKKGFYYLPMFFFPLWCLASVTSVIWGPRVMPFSLWFPLNINSNGSFFIVFLYHVFIGIFVTILTVNLELAMFSLLLQTTSQYRILVYQASEIKSHCSPPVVAPAAGNGNGNCNGVPSETRVKCLLKKCVERHLVLKRYVRQLERVFNRPLLVQFSCVVVLMVMNGVILLELDNITLKWCCQALYATIIMLDTFLVCAISTTLFEQKDKVLEAICDLPWYEMNCNMQKELILVMIGFQEEQHLTAGKVLKLNLTAFTAILKSVGSWLTFFWQVMKL